MGKPNYSFEKRQRELEKQRKKQDKASRKTSGGEAQPSDTPLQPGQPDQPAQVTTTQGQE